MPLRLMVNLSNAAGSIGESDVHGCRDRFDATLQEEGLSTGGVRLKIGNECTIGSVELAGFQGMEVDEFLERVTRVHVRFLESMWRT